MSDIILSRLDDLLERSKHGNITDMTAIELRMRRIARALMSEYALGHEDAANDVFEFLDIPAKDRSCIALGCVAFFLSSAYQCAPDELRVQYSLRRFAEPLLRIGGGREKYRGVDLGGCVFNRIDLPAKEEPLDVPGLEDSHYGLLEEVRMYLERRHEASCPPATLASAPLESLLRPSALADCVAAPKCDFGNKRISAAFNIDARRFVESVECMCDAQCLSWRCTRHLYEGADIIDLVYDILRLDAVLETCDRHERAGSGSEGESSSFDDGRSFDFAGSSERVKLFHDLFVAPLASYWCDGGAA